MIVSDEKLMAFLDGELSPAESHAMEKLISEDTALSAYVERQRALKGALAGAFAPVLSDEIPPRILKALRETPLAAPKSKLSLGGSLGGNGRLWFPVGAALAAGAILGVVAITGLSTPGLLHNEGGTLIAQGTLADTLTSELADNTVGNTATRLGVTFRDHQGHFCRTFTNQGDSGAMTGIACKVDAQWRIAALATAEKTANGGFERAGSAMPDSIRTAVAAMMAGAPLDAQAERAARNRGWNVP